MRNSIIKNDRGDISRSRTITVQGLTKRFGDVLAVDNLSLQIPSGKVTGFLGPNGAGKTTTLRILLGLVQPDSGTATIDGLPYRDLPEPTKHVGAVLENSGMYPGRTARDHLRVRALATHADDTRIHAVLEMVELSNNAGRRIGTFSLGMKQRLSLAAALLGEPSILILDEPANGLDPEGVHWLRAFLKNFANEGKTVLMSSHLLSEVAQTADDVVILNHGRLVSQSSLRELLSKAGTTNLEEVFFDLITTSNTKEVSR